jgi:hypothetical protein
MAMTSRQFRVLVALTVAAGFLGGAVSNVLLGGAPAAAQTEGLLPQVLKARSFQLVDERGAERARLGFGPDGAPFLELRDAAGKTAAELSAEPGGGSGLKLYRGGLANGGAALYVLPDGGSGLALFRTVVGKTRAGLSLAPDGSSGVELRDASGNVRAALVAPLDGSPFLDLYGAGGDLLWRAP